jgi:sensor c-di-GMP phosphodiesterase-like protein
LRRFQKYKLVAAVLGVLATSGPVLWFVTWLQKQGEAEVSITANWSVGIADLYIGQALVALNDLAARGVDSCKPAHLDALRQSLFVSPPIKELAVIGPNGQVQCTDVGTTFPRREIVASAATSNPDIMLDVVNLVDRGERMLRVRRLAAKGKPALAASLSPSLLLPQIGPEGGPFPGTARMTLADGTVIGTVTGADSGGDDQIVGRQRSERFGPIVTVTMARHGVVANYDDLRRIGMVVTGLIAFVILMCAVIVPLRQRQNPMHEIERALAADEFVPYYQPIVDITSGAVLGAEVLVRWRKPDGTVVGPGAFIPLMESTGLIIDLTRSLMRRVCEEAGPTLGRRPGMYVAFNIAPRHFENSIILNDVGSIFEGSRIRLSQLVLEVTERYQIDDLAATRRVIAALQALGCRVAMDDVGTGHNGLSHILKLGVDIIKIDKMFVDAIGTERHSQTIVATLVDLARNLRMQIVAEGVENFEQVVYLREHGISSVQGFVFAPPLPGSAFLQLVAAVDPMALEGTERAAATPPQAHSGAGRVAAA